MGVRSKVTSSQYASRARDPVFEKLMDKYKHLVKVIAIQDLILANPKNQCVSLDFLSRLSQRLHLNRGAAAFLRKYPHIFHIFYNPTKSHPFCRLTNTAFDISCLEAEVIMLHCHLCDRLLRLLSMCQSKMLPLRAIFKVWRELGLPDDFEDSVIARNSHLFQLCDAHEPGTHILKLADVSPSCRYMAAVENWRVGECCKQDCSVDRMEMRYSFKHGYPPGMKLSKNFRAKGCLIERNPVYNARRMLLDLVALGRRGLFTDE
ncbi:hypothetical protein I3843_Q040300 [Carya illinoinensis]|nr:hypothetical protein I3843_Q040300 [Carya illinoinensis]